MISAANSLAAVSREERKMGQWLNVTWNPRPKAWSFAKSGPQMQFGGTTKYVATKFTLCSGSGQKLAMRRKLPEVTCSDLPPLEHGAMAKSMVRRVGLVVRRLGLALSWHNGP